MKAVVRQHYGPPEVLHLEEVATPLPGDHDVLIRVRAASINLGDWELLTGKPAFIGIMANLFSDTQRYEYGPSSVTRTKAGFLSPKAKVLGTDLAGEIEAVGKNVTQFQVGDPVFGMSEGFGAFAEYACIPESAPIVKKDEALSFEEAAALPQATHIALQAIRDRANVSAGQRVLINGAGGGAGTLAVQLAKLYGAEVTGVDGPTKLEMLLSIGADHVIDYTKEDFTKNGREYDVILDMASFRSLSESRASLAPGGIFLFGGGSPSATFQAAFLGPLLSRFSHKTSVFLLAESRREDLVDISKLVANGDIGPVIDRRYPLAEAGQALQRVGEKQGIGKVLIIP